MKKITSMIVALAVLASNVGYAQNNCKPCKPACEPCPPKPCCTTYDRKPLKCEDMEKNMAGTECCADFQWGIAIGGLAVLGVVVGLTAAAATSNGPSYSQ